jgi:hypothetical protein
MKNIVFALLCTVLITSCATYRRCQDKFATQITDSVRVTVPVTVTVPRDSVVTSFVTDTTYLFKEIQQGRAKVIVERTNTVTTIQAECDTVTLTKSVPVKVPGPRVVWGVNPWYRTAFLVALGMLAVSLFFNLIRLKNENNQPGHDEPDAPSGLRSVRERRR